MCSSLAAAIWPRTAERDLLLGARWCGGNDGATSGGVLLLLRVVCGWSPSQTDFLGLMEVDLVHSLSPLSGGSRCLGSSMKTSCSTYGIGGGVLILGRGFIMDFISIRDLIRLQGSPSSEMEGMVIL